MRPPSFNGRSTLRLWASDVPTVLWGLHGWWAGDEDVIPLAWVRD